MKQPVLLEPGTGSRYPGRSRSAPPALHLPQAMAPRHGLFGGKRTDQRDRNRSLGSRRTEHHQGLHSYERTLCSRQKERDPNANVPISYL